jgi:hypothetical protein
MIGDPPFHRQALRRGGTVAERCGSMLGVGYPFGVAARMLPVRVGR